MEQVFNYTVDDWKKFQSFLEKDLCKSESTKWYKEAAYNIILWCVIAIFFFILFRNFNEFSWLTAGIVAFFFVSIFVYVILTAAKFKKRCAPSPEGIFIGEHSYAFDDDGIHTKGRGYSATHNWSIVQRAVKTDEAIYLFLDSAYAYIVPLSQISEPEKFCAYLSSKLNVTNV